MSFDVSIEDVLLEATVDKGLEKILAAVASVGTWEDRISAAELLAGAYGARDPRISAYCTAVVLGALTHRDHRGAAHLFFDSLYDRGAKPFLRATRGP